MRRVVNVTHVLCSLLVSCLFTTPVPSVKAALLDAGLDVLCLIAEFAEWKPRCRLSRVCTDTRRACNAADCRRLRMSVFIDPNSVDRDWISPYTRCESECYLTECIDSVTNWMIGPIVFCQSHWFSAHRPTCQVPQMVCELGQLLSEEGVQDACEYHKHGNWLSYADCKYDYVGYMHNLQSHLTYDADSSGSPRFLNDNLVITREWAEFKLVSVDETEGVKRVLKKVDIEELFEEIHDNWYWTVFCDQSENVKVTSVVVNKEKCHILVIDLTERKLLSVLVPDSMHDNGFPITPDGTTLMNYIQDNETNMKWLFSRNLLTGIRTCICPVMGCHSKTGRIKPTNEHFLEEFKDANQKIHLLVYHLSLKALIGRVNCSQAKFVGWITDDIFVVRGVLPKSDKLEYLLFSVHQPHLNLQIVTDLFEYGAIEGIDGKCPGVYTTQDRDAFALLQCRVVDSDEPSNKRQKTD